MKEIHKTTYDKIVKLLSLGTMDGVLIKDNRAEEECQYAYITHIFDGGFIMNWGSNEYEVITSKQHRKYFFSKEEINEGNYTIIRPIPKKPKVLPIGTKVRILDVVKEIDNYEIWMESVKNIKIGEISNIEDDAFGVYYKVTNKKNEYGTFPSYCVVPYDCYPIEEDKEGLIKNIEEMEKQLAEMKERLGK